MITNQAEDSFESASLRKSQVMVIPTGSPPFGTEWPKIWLSTVFGTG